MFSELMYVDADGSETKKNICEDKNSEKYQMNEPCSVFKKNRDKIITHALGKNHTHKDSGKDVDVYRYNYNIPNHNFYIRGSLYGVKSNKTLNMIGRLYSNDKWVGKDIIEIDFGTSYYTDGDYQYKNPVVLDENNNPKSGMVSVYINNKLDESYDLSSLDSMKEYKKAKLKSIILPMISKK